MTDIELKKKNRWPDRIFKIVLGLALFFTVIFMVLANLGGNSEPLKQSIEQYITDLSGYRASVETLNSMNFFPSIIIDFEGLNLYNEQDETVASASKVYLVSSFWDVTFSTGKVMALNIEYISALESIVLDKSFKLEKLNIQNENEKAAFLTGNGMVGEETFTVNTPMDVFGDPPYQKYRFPEGTIVELKKENGETIPLSFENGMIKAGE